jgi:molecular chaperone DnaJ
MQQGFFTVERGCHHCGGEGVLLKDPCKTCKGEGRVRRSRHFSVTIPRGIETGVRMRFSKEGEAGRRGATAGDLYVVVHVKDHPIFERRGEHLSCRLPVPMTVAALGGSVEVPCIDGTRAKLTIPAGTQTSDKFRMRGKGMPVMQSSAFGDMYVEVDVETPVHLTKKQQELLQSFADSLEGKESPASSGFFNKIKSLWQGLKDDAAE